MKELIHLEQYRISNRKLGFEEPMGMPLRG
jgi:hypothetical protein